MYSMEGGIEGLRDKPCEICSCMGDDWCYTGSNDHKNADEVWKHLHSIRAGEYNLLLNTGPCLPAR